MRLVRVGRGDDRVCKNPARTYRAVRQWAGGQSSWREADRGGSSLGEALGEGEGAEGCGQRVGISGKTGTQGCVQGRETEVG